MKPALILSLILFVPAPLTQDWAHKRYHQLLDGNELYSACQDAQKSLRRQGDYLSFEGDHDTVFNAGKCFGYVTAVVDSIPAGEGFEPDSDVRLTQYVDVVTSYLRDHPASRNQQAHHLARRALTDAFPKK